MKRIERIFIFVSVLLSSVSGFAQNEKADNLYDMGVKAYNNNDFKNADSLFTLSAELLPNKDIYYNLAIVKNKLGDQCNSCIYLYKAYEYGDGNAYQMYRKYCVREDTIIYKDGFYCVFESRTCSDEKDFSFYRKSDSETDSIVLLKNIKDLNEDAFLTSSFEIEKYTDTVYIDTVVIEITEVSPEFPGGADALLNFLASNIKYPAGARESNIQGTVYVSYIIEPDGSVTNVAVVRGIGGGCDEEAVRVVSMMPKWKPGMQLGKPVRVQYNLPLRFILHDDGLFRKKTKRSFGG